MCIRMLEIRFQELKVIYVIKHLKCCKCSHPPVFPNMATGRFSYPLSGGALVRLGAKGTSDTV